MEAWFESVDDQEEHNRNSLEVFELGTAELEKTELGTVELGTRNGAKNRIRAEAVRSLESCGAVLGYCRRD